MAELAVLAFPVTQSFSQSLEETILGCVAPSEPTRIMAQMHLSPTISEKQPQLTVPMLLVQHIWTFAAGYSEIEPTRVDACPCDATIDITIPPFLGGDYFCESGVNSGTPHGFHPDDPLWDGSGCTTSSSCCSFIQQLY